MRRNERHWRLKRNYMHREKKKKRTSNRACAENEEHNTIMSVSRERHSSKKAERDVFGFQADEADERG